MLAFGRALGGTSRCAESRRCLFCLDFRSLPSLLRGSQPPVPWAIWLFFSFSGSFQEATKIKSCSLVAGDLRAGEILRYSDTVLFAISVTQW